MIAELNYDMQMALICCPKILYRTFILITIFVFILCEVIGESSNFRFCEIANKRHFTFTFQVLNSTFCNQTLSACASLCSRHIECSWFTYNIHSNKCLILNIPTFQNVGSGTTELGTRHYAFTVGKSYSFPSIYSSNLYKRFRRRKEQHIGTLY